MSASNAAVVDGEQQIGMGSTSIAGDRDTLEDSLHGDQNSDSNFDDMLNGIIGVKTG